MKIVQKWGFGMAPLKNETHQKNRMALRCVRDFIVGEGTAKIDVILDSLSRVKGLFNRIMAQSLFLWDLGFRS